MVPRNLKIFPCPNDNAVSLKCWSPCIVTFCLLHDRVSEWYFSYVSGCATKMLGSCALMLMSYSNHVINKSLIHSIIMI